MIKKIIQEYREGDLAVRTTVISFLCIPIFKFRETTTNNSIVNQLTVIKELNKIKGFKYENEN